MAEQKDQNPTKGIGSHNRKDTTKPKGNSWFLGIGINKYQHFPELNNARKDVKDIILLLQEQYDLGKEKTFTLYDEEATRDSIISTFHRLARDISDTDKLIIYYSGHGHLDQVTKLSYWIPQEAKKDQTSNYIPNSTVRDYLKVINSMHTLLISDSCFSGSLFVRGSKRSTTTALHELEQRKSRWGIASGRHDEEVHDGLPGTNSPFAASLLKVLSRNHHSDLNVARLADQVVEMTRSNYEQLPEGNPLFGVGHDGGQYIFKLRNNESLYWEACTAEHSIASYNAYLDKFPDGLHADQALHQINILEEEQEWESVRKKDRIYFYRIFLRNFPGSKFALEAHERIRELGDKTPVEDTPAVPVKRGTETVAKAPPPSDKNRKLPNTIWRYAGGALLLILAVWGVTAISKSFRSKPTMPEETSNSIVPEVKLGDRTYRTIKVGTLVWMAENLDYKTEDSRYNEGLFFDESRGGTRILSDTSKYGRLYTWTAAKAACTSFGWRLPTEQEWRDLVLPFGGVKGESKDNGIAAFNALIEGGSSGLDLLLGGSFSLSTHLTLLDGFGHYWSSTKASTPNNVRTLELYQHFQQDGYVTIGTHLITDLILSCRCVKEN